MGGNFRPVSTLPSPPQSKVLWTKDRDDIRPPTSKYYRSDKSALAYAENFRGVAKVLSQSCDVTNQL